MNTFISYERIEKKINVSQIQEVFTEIIHNGNDIIYYKEEQSSKEKNEGIINIVIITGKKRDIL